MFSKCLFVRVVKSRDCVVKSFKSSPLDKSLEVRYPVAAKFLSGDYFPLNSDA